MHHVLALHQVCADDVQNTFALTWGGRGITSHVTTAFDTHARHDMRLLRELRGRLPDQRAEGTRSGPTSRSGPMGSAAMKPDQIGDPPALRRGLPGAP